MGPPVVASIIQSGSRIESGGGEMGSAVRVAIMIACIAGPAAAQTGDPARFPARAIRVVVPFAPGGPSDLPARIVGQKMTEAWGQQVIVDNRGGAGGIVGVEIVAKAPP